MLKCVAVAKAMLTIREKCLKHYLKAQSCLRSKKSADIKKKGNNKDQKGNQRKESCSFEKKIQKWKIKPDSSRKKIEKT